MNPAYAAPGTSLLKWSAALCTLVGTVLWIGPTLLRPDLYSDDATQHIYWLYRFADPTLFPGDLSIEYFGSGSVAPWGYRTLYAVLAPFIDAQIASEIVAALLLVATCWMAWLIGTEIGRRNEPAAAPTLGLLCVLAVLAVVHRVDLLPPTGFQRTFALPLVLLCVWGLASERYRWVGVSWVIAAVIYPVIVPVLGLAAAIVFLTDLIQDRRMPQDWVWNGVLGIATLAIVWLGTGVPDGIGPMVTYAQAQQMPEFGTAGRQSLFGVTWQENWFYHHRTGLGWSPKLVLALVVATIAVISLGGRQLISRAFWITAGVGLITWFVARLTLFHLYLPNRHSRWSLAAFAVVVLAVAAWLVLSAILKKVAAPQKTPALVARVTAVAAPVIVAILYLPMAARDWARPVDHDLENAFIYLAGLPVDTLVAAHPDVANPVPLRTKHSVLASTELSISFMLGYHARLQPRIESSLRAAYASDWAEFDRVLAPYGVQAFLSTPAVWNSPGYFPPLDGLVSELKQDGQEKGFVLQTPPADRILFRSGDVYVVRVGAGGDGSR